MIATLSRTLVPGLLCAAFVALTLNQGVYSLLYATALLSVGLFIRDTGQDSLPCAVRRLKLPLLFVALTALTPGTLFADMPLAGPVLAAFLCGIGAVRAEPTSLLPRMLPRIFSSESGCKAALPVLYWPFFFLLLSLTLQLLSFFLAAKPDMLWDSRLTLRFDHPNVLGYVAAWGVLFGCSILPRVFADCRTHATFRVQFGAALWVVLLVGSIAVVALAGSRGVYAGLGLGLVPVLLLVYRRRLFQILLVLALVAGASVFCMPERHQARLVSALQNPLTDITIQARQPIWRAALAGFCEAPLLGSGLRSFANYHEAWVRNNQKLEEAIVPTETRVANPHNLYIGLLYAYGVLGTGLLLLLVGNGVRLAVRTLRLPPHSECNANVDAVLFLASLCFLLGAGLVDYSLHRKEGILMLFLPLGMLYGRALPIALDAEKTPDSDSSSRLV